MEKFITICKSIIGKLILLAVLCYSMYCFIIGGIDLLQNWFTSSTIVYGVAFLSAFIFAVCEMLGFMEFMTRVFKKDK